MRIELPDKVDYIITTLIENGYEAYAVGGCVRDSILNKIPEDWDITTSASPQQVKLMFKHTIDTGIQHGTVTVMLEKEGFEVTTYRIDGEYEDNRHPKQVEFTKSLKEDLARRDFTINAMAYNHKEGLVDIFSGYEDIKRGRICCVGSAKDRFEEDALRILRAVRFSAQLDFEIEENTMNAIREKAANLEHISAERIRVELSKLLLSHHPDRLITAYQSKITAVILPEFDKMMETKQENKHHCYNVGIHSLKAIEWMTSEEKLRKENHQKDREEEWTSILQSCHLTEKKCSLILRLAALLHDVAKPFTKEFDSIGMAHFYCHEQQGAKMAEEILRRLKFDNETIQTVVKLILYHDYRYDKIRHGCTPAGIRRAANKIGAQIIELLFYLQEADTMAQEPAYQKEKLELLKKAKNIYQEVKQKGECICLGELALNGKDLIENGYKQGKELGSLLNQLLEHVIEHPQDNQKKTLLELLKKTSH